MVCCVREEGPTCMRLKERFVLCFLGFCSFFNEYSFDGMFEFVFSDSTIRKQQII